MLNSTHHCNMHRSIKSHTIDFTCHTRTEGTSLHAKHQYSEQIKVMSFSYTSPPAAASVTAEQVLRKPTDNTAPTENEATIAMARKMKSKTSEHESLQER